MDFRIDDRVVYPNHGIGIIESIEKTELGGQSCTFYCLRIMANETRVRVPTYNAANVGLRKMIGRRQLSSLFEQLKQQPRTANP